MNRLMLLGMMITLPCLAANLGDVAGNLTGPVLILFKMVLFAGYILGASLLVGSIMLYRQHREQPKLVPLATPILLAILGSGVIFTCYTILNKDSELSASTGTKTFSAASKAREVREQERERAREQRQRAERDGGAPSNQPAPPPSQPSGGNDYWSY